MHLPEGGDRVVRSLGRTSMVLAALAALGFLLAACGSSSGSPGIASLGSTTTSTAPPAAQGTGATSKIPDPAAFSQCMRSHGVPSFPMPVTNGNHVSLTISPAIEHSPHYRSALAHCRSLLPRGAESPTITPADQADYLRGTACMRSHGFHNFPDPTISGNQVHFDVPASINQGSAQFRQAVQTCERLIPAGLPYSDNGGS